LSAEIDSTVSNKNIQNNNSINDSNIVNDEDMAELRNDAKKMIEMAENLKQKADKLYNDAESSNIKGSSDKIETIKYKAREMQQRAELLKIKAMKLYAVADNYQPDINQKISDLIKLELKDINNDKKSNMTKDAFKIFTKKAKEIKDTLQILTIQGTKSFLENFISKKRSSRERGYGIGFGPSIGLFAVNIAPVKELCPVLGGEYKNIISSISNNYESFLLMGGTGYFGFGNGLRIGGEGRGGSKNFSLTVNDTTWFLRTSVGFGGVLIEKNTIKNSMNMLIGGILGGGNLSITPSYSDNIFNPVENPNINTKQLKATFMLFEIHAGFTYTMVNWFHIGASISTPVFIAPDGFKGISDISYTSGFLTVNPGICLRLIFGNIG